VGLINWILFNRKGVYKVRELIRTVEEFEQYLDEEACYIFGAGVVAKAAVTWLRRKEKQIQSVIVTNRNTKTDFLGFPLKNLSEVENMGHSIVIVALMEKSHNEIENILNEVNIRNILYISDVLYYLLECQNGNHDLVEIHLLNGIKWKIQEEENKRRAERIKYIWSSQYERNIVSKNWHEYYERSDFAERFQSLIRGLDQQSVETVVRIINRQKQYLSSDEEEMDLYTAKEKTDLEQLYDNFYALIIKLSSELYMYNGYYLTENRFEPSVFFYKYGTYKLHNLKKIEHGVFFDIGGYIGDSAMIFQEFHPKQIYSFEAIPQQCIKMKKNLKLNNIKNVIVENMALGDEVKEVEMEVSGSTSNYIHRSGITVMETIKVQMRTLDDYISENNIHECSLIKIDIEGAESYFLKGAKQTIVDFKPVILLSIYHNEHDFFELKPLIESWKLGYRFQIYKPTNGNLTNETLLIAEVY